MAYTYHGTSELIALPNRTVTTYPSGLVRVERSFVCRASQVKSFRNIIRVGEHMPSDDGAPAFDGLYIFPEPQEIVRDDGFVEFFVTGYGRASEKSNFITNTLVKGTITNIDSPAIGQVNVFTSTSINNLYTIRGVAINSPANKSYLIPPKVTDIFIASAGGPPLQNLDEVMKVFINNGAAYIESKKSVVIGLGLDGFTSVNFGFFDEYVISWVATAIIRTSQRTVIV